MGAGRAMNRVVDDPFRSLLKIAQKLVGNYSLTLLKELLKGKDGLESYGTSGGGGAKRTHKNTPFAHKKHQKKNKQYYPDRYQQVTATSSSIHAKSSLGWPGSRAYG